MCFADPFEEIFFAAFQQKKEKHSRLSFLYFELREFSLHSTLFALAMQTETFSNALSKENRFLERMKENTKIALKFEALRILQLVSLSSIIQGFYL